MLIGMGNPVYGAGMHAGIELGKAIGRAELTRELLAKGARALGHVAGLAAAVGPMVVDLVLERRRQKAELSDAASEAPAGVEPANPSMPAAPTAR